MVYCTVKTFRYFFLILILLMVNLTLKTVIQAERKLILYFYVVYNIFVSYLLLSAFTSSKSVKKKKRMYVLHIVHVHFVITLYKSVLLFELKWSIDNQHLQAAILLANMY